MIPVAVSTVDAAAGGAWTVVVAYQNNQRAVLAARGRAAWAFAATGLGAIGVATIFTGLYPRVLVSDPSFGDSVTISNAASGRYALEVITVVAVVFTPVLFYQGWTYHVFRARLGGAEGPAPAERPGEPQAG